MLPEGFPPKKNSNLHFGYRTLHQQTMFSSKDSRVTQFTCKNITKWLKNCSQWTHGVLSCPRSYLWIAYLYEVTSLYEYDLIYQLSWFIIMSPPLKQQYHSTQKTGGEVSTPPGIESPYGSMCNFVPQFTFPNSFIFWVHPNNKIIRKTQTDSQDFSVQHPYRLVRAKRGFCNSWISISIGKRNPAFLPLP